MTEVLGIERIKQALANIDVVDSMKAAFEAYSQGRVEVPPVGELIFKNPPGETHIKYGYRHDGDFFVVKIASGFYHNPQIGLSSSQGLMLLFCRKTGCPKAVLLDDGHLTDIRTAAAGALVAKHLAPKKVNCIGILGAGIQARLQLKYLQQTISCNRVLVWAPTHANHDTFMDFFAGQSLDIRFCDIAEIGRNANLIVTTTPSQKPLLNADDIQPGCHITAVGADTSEKIELDPRLLGKADVLIVDSLAQSKQRGEVYQSVKAGCIDRSRVRELGAFLSTLPHQRADHHITIADLTGVAVQDLHIATAVYEEAST